MLFYDFFSRTNQTNRRISPILTHSRLHAVSMWVRNEHSLNKMQVFWFIASFFNISVIFANFVQENSWITCICIIFSFLQWNFPKSISWRSAQLRVRTGVAVVIALLVRRAVRRVVQETVSFVVVAVSEVSYSAVFWVRLAVIIWLFKSVWFLLAALVGAFLLLGLLGGLLFGLFAPLPFHASVLEPDFHLRRRGVDSSSNRSVKKVIGHHCSRVLFIDFHLLLTSRHFSL